MVTAKQNTRNFMDFRSFRGILQKKEHLFKKNSAKTAEICCIFLEVEEFFVEAGICIREILCKIGKSEKSAKESLIFFMKFWKFDTDF